jgi:hypothetical protein
VDRTDLLSALLRSLRTEYDAFQRGELVALRTAYADACATVGREGTGRPADRRHARRSGDRYRRGRPSSSSSAPGGLVPVSAGDVVHATIVG